jgi:3-deoxy-D-manno-octulosonate 8-phosphate phosphatase (KDO 8-P phosphatase)
MNKTNPLPLNIEMVLFDVDGVLTDGTIYMSDQGEFLKAFNVKDGLAIELLRSHGILTGVISGKSSPALSLRCEQLGFNKVITGCKNKLPKLKDICEQYSISLANIAFCGDDVLDLPIFNHVGLSVAPADAHKLVLNKADWITQANGGRGMVREFVDELLCSQKNCSLEEIYQPLMNKIILDDTDGIEQ